MKTINRIYSLTKRYNNQICSKNLKRQEVIPFREKQLNNNSNTFTVLKARLLPLLISQILLLYYQKEI